MAEVADTMKRRSATISTAQQRGRASIRCSNPCSNHGTATRILAMHHERDGAVASIGRTTTNESEQVPSNLSIGTIPSILVHEHLFHAKKRSRLSIVFVEHRLLSLGFPISFRRIDAVSESPKNRSLELADKQEASIEEYMFFNGRPSSFRCRDNFPSRNDIVLASVRLPEITAFFA